MIATIPSATVLGVEGRAISVEVHVSNGLPAFNIVGLPDVACREARDRVRSALLSSNLPWPQKRVTVNLAPSSVRKIGTGLDLPILIGVLVATEHLSHQSVLGTAFVGELGLDGTVRAMSGIVPLVDAIASPTVVVPFGSVRQAELVGRHEVHGAETVGAMVAALTGERSWPRHPEVATPRPGERQPNMADVRGQPLARWALELAAAGGHNLLMTGPPGSGKTMLAQRLPGLLPELDAHTALVCTRVHSAAGVLGPLDDLMVRPPLRAPHHTCSVVSMVGGGAGAMHPGEISLAHGGVLFLDEMGEFPRAVLESLRQPLESGEVVVSRAAGTVRYPARFQVVGATNPCPCGEGPRSPKCRCTDDAISRYRSRMSSPLLDRFDIRLDVQRPSAEQFLASNAEESSDVVRGRVLRARALAHERGVRCNADLRTDQLRGIAPLEPAAHSLLRRRLENGSLSGRGLERARRVALTLADIEGFDGPLSEAHVAAALQLQTQTADLMAAS